jgi:hypothetical protein
MASQGAAAGATLAGMLTILEAVLSRFSIRADSRRDSLVEVEQASQPLPSSDAADGGERIAEALAWTASS